uniref:DegQ family serine endoprotease n=1 Tax=Neisseria leonii TaxID=2995413 RepID=UPI003F586530
MNFPSKSLALAVAAVLAVSACGKKDQEAGALVKQIEATTGNGSTVTMLLPDFTKLVAQEGASVVNIQAAKLPSADSRSERDTGPFADNDPFYDFFRRLVPNAPQLQEPEEENEQNFGSGFIISADGYILTNTHVLSGMNNIKVTLNDKREYTARLIGSDRQSDVALLKIDAEGLPAVKIGDAKSLKPGEWVAAIGAPFGFNNSITAGIVSAKGRSLPNENYTPFIQTDVAINPGNSGGPLFNLNGEVVGINSQIYSRSGGFMGISFAIPIDVAMNVADQLKTSGKVQRGQLGVIIQEVSYDLAKSFQLDKPAGALIARVMPGSPAERAGLQVGDIVRSVNGEEVRASSDLPVMVGAIAPGKEITLGIWRQGQEIEQRLTLGNADDNNRMSSSGSRPDDGADNTGSAFRIDDVGLELIGQTVGGERRLMVVRVEGAAVQAGLRRGDYILSVGQERVSDEATFRNALQSAGASVPLLVERGGNTVFLALSRP